MTALRVLQAGYVSVFALAFLSNVVRVVRAVGVFFLLGAIGMAAITASNATLPLVP